MAPKLSSRAFRLVLYEMQNKGSFMITLSGILLAFQAFASGSLPWAAC